MNTYQYIYEIHKEKSFSKAAANLYISQPSLSTSVRKIEQQLGYEIFDRSSSALNLTEAGEAYVKAAQEILEIEKNLKDYLADMSELRSGHIVVSGSAFFSSYVLGPILKAFRERYPGITVEFIEADSLRLYEEALKSHIDLIVDGGGIDEALFEKHMLFQEHILLGISLENPICQQLPAEGMSVQDIRMGRHLSETTEGIDLAWLHNERFVLLKKGHDLYERAVALCRERDFEPKTDIHLNQLMTAYHSAINNLGCVFLSDTLAGKAEDGINMAYYKIKAENEGLLQRDVFIVHRKNRQVTRAMRTFIQVGRELYHIY